MTVSTATPTSPRSRPAPAARAPDPRPALATLAPADLAGCLAECGAAPYRATQLRRAAFAGGAEGFDAVPLLPRELRRALGTRLRYQTLTLAAEREADRGLTRKLLLGADDGEMVETVAMAYRAAPGHRARQTVCVSTQVGCAIGCAFCATGQLGLRRQLHPAEIVDQVRWAARQWRLAGDAPPSHVVFMGMGEPLQDVDATAAAVRALGWWGIAPRRVVVSTSGIVPAIDRLGELGLGVTLALSLHATLDPLRDRLVPLNRRWPIAACLEAGRRYARGSGRRLTLEYVLIAGVNDGDDDARRLRRIAAGAGAHCNLIPMNGIPGSPWHAPTPARVRAFAARVGPRATIRFSRGDRVQAACGQLRAELTAPAARAARILGRQDEARAIAERRPLPVLR